MGVKQLAALAGALFASTQSFALEPQFQDSLVVPMTTFYMSIPLGGTTAKEKAFVYGLNIQGRQRYETVNIDSRMFLWEGLAAIEAKWLIAGGVVAAGGAVVANKNHQRSNNYSQSQNQQQASGCTQPGDPCAKK